MSITGTIGDDNIFRFDKSSLSDYVQTIADNIIVDDVTLDGTDENKLNIERLKSIIEYSKFISEYDESIKNRLLLENKLTNIRNALDKIGNDVTDIRLTMKTLGDDNYSILESLVAETTTISTTLNTTSTNLIGEINSSVLNLGIRLSNTLIGEDVGTSDYNLSTNGYDNISMAINGTKTSTIKNNLSSNLSMSLLGIERGTIEHNTMIKEPMVLEMENSGDKEVALRMDYFDRKSSNLMKAIFSGQNAPADLDASVKYTNPDLYRAMVKSKTNLLKDY